MRRPHLLEARPRAAARAACPELLRIVGQHFLQIYHELWESFERSCQGVRVCVRPGNLFRLRQQRSYTKKTWLISFDIDIHIQFEHFFIFPYLILKFNGPHARAAATAASHVDVKVKNCPETFVLFKLIFHDCQMFACCYYTVALKWTSFDKVWI